MGQIVGIDLGTTYSAVAIPGDHVESGFFSVPECPGYTVILDPLKRRITPSVVAEDETGRVVVGYSAKGRAGLSPDPVMFAKRSMGEDVTFALASQGSLTPEEVSAHILRYLKEMAEARLGEPVDEAVITVPAYFSLRAKQMTEKAGELAGLKVAQVAPEPVAAALMYCVGDERDPLRIMTYDLGGGTFDVAVLEKRDGIISGGSVLTFDGDRFLGGYDFDKDLAFWILDQLNALGYDLHLNHDNPADKVIFSKLMIYAERAKIELSRSESYEFEERTTGISDHSGNPVVIEMIITREEFEGLISSAVDYTLQICCRAMAEKAKNVIDPATIDEIIMVGGSSRIPLVARRLEEKFGRQPKLIQPDLCVALGAAIIAGTIASCSGCLRLDPLPAETDLRTLTVTGQVVPGDGLVAAAGCTVSLQATDGSYRSSRTVGAEGTFVFDGVPLAVDDTTDFILTVASPAGAELRTHSFSLRQTDVPLLGPGRIPSMLAKPINIELSDGPHEIAPARAVLPYKTVVPAKTRDDSGTIRVPVLEENNTLGTITMEVPTSLPIGSAIELTLTLQQNYQIVGHAYVPAIGRDATTVIDIPVPPKRTLEELRMAFEEADARAQDALSGARTGARFTIGNQLKQRLQACSEMLQAPAPELAQIQDCLDEIETLTRRASAGWKPQPPRAMFEAKAREAEDLIARVVKQRPDAAQDGYEERLSAIRAEADQSYAEQDTAAWKDSYNRIVQLCDTLDGMLGREGPPPDPASLLIALARELAALERTARDRGRYEKLKDDFAAAAASLKNIKPDASSAMAEIRDWYVSRLDPLRKRIEDPGDGIPDPDEKRKG